MKMILLLALMFLLVGCDETVTVVKPAVKPQEVEVSTWLKNNGFKFIKEPTLEEMTIVYAEAKKIPEKLFKIIMQENSGIDIVLGKSIVDHPKYAYLSGKRPRGWPEGTTWDMCPGVGGNPGQPAVIALYGKSGSSSTLIHEFGHTFDFCMNTLSSGFEWQAIWKSLSQSAEITQYEKDYADEAFAEGMARYFVGPPPKAILLKSQTEYLDKIALYDRPVLTASVPRIVRKIKSPQKWIPKVENFKMSLSW